MGMWWNGGHEWDTKTEKDKKSISENGLNLDGKGISEIRKKPKWWKGRHSSLKKMCLKERVGSNPTFGTKAP